MKKLLPLLFICVAALGQATNPQNNYPSAVQVASPSLWLNYNDATAAFKDSVSGSSFTQTIIAYNGTTPSSTSGGNTGGTIGVNGTPFAHSGTLQTIYFQSNNAPVSPQTFLILSGTAPNLTIVSSFTATVAATTSPQLLYAGVNFTAPTVTSGEYIGNWVSTGNAVGYQSTGTTGVYFLTGQSSLPAGSQTYSVAAGAYIVFGGLSITSPGTPTLQQPGFDSDVATNYSAKFPYNGISSAPNNTLGAFEWTDARSILIHVDRLNWNRTGALVLASKGDVGAATNSYWELYLQMSGLISQLCFVRNSNSTPYTSGASGGVAQTVCSDSGTDAMPNGYNYNIVVTQTGVTGIAADLSIYINGLYYGSGNSVGTGFGGATINASGGTGYANVTHFIGVGGGPNCTISGTMSSTGGVPNTSSGFALGQNYGCTSVPSITFNYSVTSPLSNGVSCISAMATTVTTASCTVTGVTTGSAIIMGTMPPDTTGVTDTNGTPVLLAGTPSGYGPVYYEANAASGSHTLTFTAAAVHSVTYLPQVQEIRGADTTSPIDTAAYSAGTGTAVSVGPVTTSAVNEYLFSFVEAFGGSSWSNPTGGFTYPTGTNSTVLGYRQAPSIGTYTFGITQGVSNAWDGQLIAIKPLITTYAPTGTGVSLTYGLNGATMNSTSLPVFAPGYVSGSGVYGIDGTDSTQTSTYIDEFTEFPSALNFNQISNIYYETKFYQGILNAKPANPIQFIFDDDGGADLDNFWALQSSVALQNLGYLQIVGAVQEVTTTCEVGLFRQMLDQAGLANVPVGTIGTLTSGSSGAACTLANVNTYNASTLAQVSSFPSAATVYRQAMANNPTTPVLIFAAGGQNGIGQFMQSSPDSISSLTGLQLWNRNAANGGAVYFQCCFQYTSPYDAYILANQGAMPFYYMEGTPQNTGPGPLYTRIATDPMWLASTSWGSDVRQGWDSLPAVFAVTKKFVWGVQVWYNLNAVTLTTVVGGTGYANPTAFTLTGGGAGCSVTGSIPAISGILQNSGITYATNGNCNSSPTGITLTAPTGTGATFSYSFSGSAGSGYANRTYFTLSGGGATCEGSGIMTASSGVPTGITTLTGVNPNIYGGFGQVGLGSGCSTVPTVTMTAPTGTGVSLTATTLLGGTTPTFVVWPNQKTAPGQTPIFTWFLNSLIDPTPNRSPIQIPQ
jgi:hypothetical protein